MKPAICYLCGKMAIEEPKNDKGDWLKFANFNSNSINDLGHSEGLEYFCNEHISAAKLLLQKTSEEAHTMLLEQFDDLKKTKKVVAKRQSNIWSRIFAIFKS